MKSKFLVLYFAMVSCALAQQQQYSSQTELNSNDNRPNLLQGSHTDKISKMNISIVPPRWADWRGAYYGLSVEIGDPPAKLMPGGNDYGVISAISGTIDVPAAADANMIDKVTPGYIITSGVLGVARSASTAAPAVGVYGGGHIGATNAQAWGANFTSKNFDTSGVPPKHGFNGQVYGVEVDVSLVDPAVGWAGSNVDGIWITGEWHSKVDGQMSGLHIGAQGTAGWKNAIKTDHGSATEFAEIGKAERSGASPSQMIHLISSDGKGDYHALIQADPDGSVSIRPNFYGQTKGLIVSSADPTHFVKVHPVEGIAAPSVTTRGLLLNLDGKGAKVVSVGPPDSCGKGHRCLSVPN